jgi:general nucleoside transport system permease protein
MPGSNAHEFGWLIPLLLATLYNATPLVLAALAGVLSERAGVVNIALEGLMLAGAFAGVWAGQGSPIAGLVSALAAGALLGLLHAILTQKARMNHVVSGLGITLLAAGGTRFLFQRVFPSSGIDIKGLPREFFVMAAVVLPFVVAFVVSRTRFGLRLRAAGENPESARMAGISPFPSRVAAVTLSGVLGALAGAYLSMAEAHRFSPMMSAGKGYIALAAVIFGKWSPLGAALGALFFGFFDALQSQLQISGVHIVWMGVEWTSPYLLQSLPYLMTIVALVSVVGRATPPAALGREEA